MGSFVLDCLAFVLLAVAVETLVHAEYLIFFRPQSKFVGSAMWFLFFWMLVVGCSVRFMVNRIGPHMDWPAETTQRVGDAMTNVPPGIFGATVLLALVILIRRVYREQHKSVSTENS